MIAKVKLNNHLIKINKNQLWTKTLLPCGSPMWVNMRCNTRKIKAFKSRIFFCETSFYCSYKGVSSLTKFPGFTTCYFKETLTYSIDNKYRDRTVQVKMVIWHCIFLWYSWCMWHREIYFKISLGSTAINSKTGSGKMSCKYHWAVIVTWINIRGHCLSYAVTFRIIPLFWDKCAAVNQRKVRGASSLYVCTL